MAVLTLIESAKFAANRGEVQASAIIEQYARESDLLRALPFLSIPGSAYSYNVENAMPGIAFRSINGTYTPSAGVVNPQAEVLKIAGGEIDVDRALVKMHGPQQRAWTEMAKVKELARQISYQLIEGDTASNSIGFNGLKARVPTTGTQALDLGSAGASAMSLKKLDQLVYMVDNPTHILMSKEQELNVRAYLRSGGSGAAAIQIEKDEFGRPLLTYAGLPILIANRNGDVATLAYGEASSTASLFVLSVGMDTYHGLQNGGIEVKDLGELQSSPAYRTRVEWLVAQCVKHPRAVARGFNFTNATAVA